MMRKYSARRHHRLLLTRTKQTMFKWVQSGLSTVAGTAEPEYGREAIHPVTDAIHAGEVDVYRPTTSKDFEWATLSSTSVQTQTFYFTDLDAGIVGFAQIIHSNIMSVHTTAQFTFRLHRVAPLADGNAPVDVVKATSDPKTASIWTSTKLTNFRTDGPNFYADFVALELDQETDTYTIRSSVNEESLVDLKVQRLSPGVVFGHDGITKYGDNKDEPWGLMRHVFWPRCKVEGTITTPSDSIKITGYSMFVMALQDMKPHHAAKAWNFINFQSRHYAAVQMEFTTPKSYAATKVNVGLIASDSAILHASIDNAIEHQKAEVDEVGWPVPKSIEFKYVSANEKEPVTVATVKGPLDVLVERVDVMAEIPQFIKSIVTGVVGTKPFIYQYSNEFELEFNSPEKLLEGKPSEQLTLGPGIAFNEVTFITE